MDRSRYTRNVANSDSEYFIYDYINIREYNFDTSRGNNHASALMHEIQRLLHNARLRLQITRGNKLARYHWRGDAKIELSHAN